MIYMYIAWCYKSRMTMYCITLHILTISRLGKFIFIRVRHCCRTSFISATRSEISSRILRRENKAHVFCSLAQIIITMSNNNVFVAFHYLSSVNDPLLPRNIYFPYCYCAISKLGELSNGQVNTVLYVTRRVFAQFRPLLCVLSESNAAF